MNYQIHGAATNGTKPPPRLLDQVRAAIRTRHYSQRTGEAYVHWARHFVLFHGKRHPSEMGETEVGQFLQHLAVNKRVSASTQNQALNALLFLYGSVLKSKQLIRFEGQTLVRRAVDAANGAKCLPIVVVGSDKSSEIEVELKGTNAVLVRNKNWKSGIGSSIRRGIQHLISEQEDVDAVALLVCDQPFVDAAIIKGLIARRTQTGKAIAASSYASTLGVPAIFDRSLFSQLLALNDATGAKPVILQNRDKVTQLPFPEGKIDIDTIEDWEQLDQRLPA